MPTLGYWKLRGLAQPIRLLLEYVGEKYDETFYEQKEGPTYSKEEWYQDKPRLNLDFPNLPYYIDGNIKITQSNAIIRYIARKHNLLGSTEEERIRVDMMLENAMDFRNGLVRLIYNPEYDSLRDDYFKRLPSTLEQFDKYLVDKSWFAGSTITACDFPMYELLDQHKEMQSECLDKYPNLVAFLNRFEELPQIKAYMQSEKFKRRPINGKNAKFT